MFSEAESKRKYVFLFYQNIMQVNDIIAPIWSILTAT